MQSIGADFLGYIRWEEKKSNSFLGLLLGINGKMLKEDKARKS